MANYIEVTALKRQVSAVDLMENYNYKLRQIQYKTGDAFGGERNILYPMSKAELDSINKITRELGALDTDIVTQNFSKLQRNRDIGEYAQGMMRYYFNGLRRTFVSGQLGGKMVPNVPYKMENLLTDRDWETNVLLKPLK